MKPLLILILSLAFTLTAMGQQQDYPDSGFTNKAEAKNLPWTSYQGFNRTFLYFTVPFRTVSYP
ncbi:MAG: hypothetical protein ACLQQ4_13440 [Bacteroidia bacterium]